MVVDKIIGQGNSFDKLWFGIRRQNGSAPTSEQQQDLKNALEEKPVAPTNGDITPGTALGGQVMRYGANIGCRKPENVPAPNNGNNPSDEPPAMMKYGTNIGH